MATAEALRAGKIVAVKGLGGFHLMCDARNGHAVAQLRARKQRPHKPLAVMVRDLAQAATLAELPPEAARLLLQPEAPIVLLRRLPTNTVAPEVAPENPYLGVMLPATPLHHLLLRALDFPLVATSGNLSDEPICIDEHAATTHLGRVADAFLVHNRPIVRHCDDSVAALVAGAPALLRRARGYAPLPILLPRPIACILAVGAQQKNTIALSIGNQAVISQHIGDMATPEAIAAFEHVIADFVRLYAATPVAVAHDLHPDYFPTRYARTFASARGLRTVGVQHHHAHMAACLAEYQAGGPALGVIWDGTGYGPDATIWGGEFLLGDASGYTRVAHLYPFRLPGGEAAVREPRRSALALLWEIMGPAALERDDLAPIRSFEPAERQVLAHMLARGINAIPTTSAGRLFDGVAALLGLHLRASFEGQAAMALEFIADPAVADAYPWDLIPGQPWQVDWRPTIDAVVAELGQQVPPSVIAARFHNTLVASIQQLADTIGCGRMVLSGGCFQNRLLTERTLQRLDPACEVLLPRQVPPNDGGISLGQLLVAAATYRIT